MYRLNNYSDRLWILSNLVDRFFKWILWLLEWLVPVMNHDSDWFSTNPTCGEPKTNQVKIPRTPRYCHKQYKCFLQQLQICPRSKHMATDPQWLLQLSHRLPKFLLLLFLWDLYIYFVSCHAFMGISCPDVVFGNQCFSLFWIGYGSSMAPHAPHLVLIKMFLNPHQNSSWIVRTQDSGLFWGFSLKFALNIVHPSEKHPYS